MRGGLVTGGLYMVLGRPGSGKTTFGNHLVFNFVKSGGKALYVTVVAETHDRMLNYLSGFEFMEFDQVGRRVDYLSVYDELLENGLNGVQATLRRVIREQGYGLVVVDGADILEMSAESDLEYSRFIADTSAQMGMLGCTGLLLAVHTGDMERNSIAPYVDGIFVLEDHSVGLQDVRYIHIVKVRGVGHIRGRHRFTISKAGIEIYPRIEAVLDESISDPRSYESRLSTGVTGLDDILRGGLIAGAMTMVWGPPGIGKSILGLQFIIEGVRRGQPGLLATFHESSRSLVAMAQGLGQDLQPYLDSGLIRIFPNISPEIPVDDWAWQLLNEIEDHKPSRVVIDGISDVVRLRLESHRTAPFFKALTGAFTTRGITAIFTAEAPEMYVSNVTVPRSDLATSSDTVILLRYVEVTSRMHRILTVLKVRGAAYDHGAREFHITDGGIDVSVDSESASRILAAARRPWVYPEEAANRPRESGEMQ